MNEANMGFNKFCGPAALSILTGKNTDECADQISRVNGHYKIKGVMVADLIAAGNRLGLDFNKLIVYEGRTLFFTASQLSRKDGRYLVLIPKHFIVLEVKSGNIQLCDNHTKTPIDLQNSARLSQRVEAVYSVHERPAPPIINIVSRELSAEYVGGSIMVKRIVKYSDGTFKIYPNGTITLEKKEIQDFSFKLMQLTDPFESKEE